MSVRLIGAGHFMTRLMLELAMIIRGRYFMTW